MNLRYSSEPEDSGAVDGERHKAAEPPSEGLPSSRPVVSWPGVGQFARSSQRGNLQAN